MQVVEDHIETLYAYGMPHVIFKSALAAKKQFRSTFAGGSSYFATWSNAVLEGKGFAIKGWSEPRFENADILT